ncbi:MAG: hypothetical protein ABL886_11170 [Rhodoglobus sp.]
MSVLHGIRVTVWFEGGVPYGLIWEGRHYRVTDTPTRLEDEMAVLTHPLDIIGWRFQGTGDDEVSRMFDIRLRGADWELMRSYV